MPWTCCEESHPDSLEDCPKCGKPKGKWTLRFDKTRRFVLAGKTVYEAELEFGEEEPDYEDELELGEEEPDYEDELELGPEDEAAA